MFCKFCGKRIEPTEAVCPYCSASQEPRSGGSGYWDILDHADASSPARPAPAAAPAPTPAPDSRMRNAILKTKRASMLSWIVVLVCTLCAIAIATVVTAANLGDLEKKIDDAISYLENSKASAAESTPFATTKEMKTINDNIFSLEKRVGDLETQIAELKQAEESDGQIENSNDFYG